LLIAHQETLNLHEVAITVRLVLAVGLYDGPPTQAHERYTCTHWLSIYL